MRLLRVSTVRFVCCTSVEKTPRCTVMIRAILSTSSSLRSTRICRSRAKGTKAMECAGIGSARPSPMNLPSPKTLTGPLSSTESVGFLMRMARKGKVEFPRGLSES